MPDSGVQEQIGKEQPGRAGGYIDRLVVESYLKLT